MLHSTVAAVTQRIRERSQKSREKYLEKVCEARKLGVYRSGLSCGNLAHGFAACESGDKSVLAVDRNANIGIVSSYNDMLSAHHPFKDFPDIIKQTVRESGAVAQVAGMVPAMCDGVTQGQDGMELSLFSRDLIAMSTAISLSHNMFDGVMCLGVCDKIVPGLLIGALSFGHLPVLFVPAGPMRSGLPNSEKHRIRQLYAAGKIGREELLECESNSYHSAGTCTFYGTANSNQLLMEFMGLQLPGSSFVNPDTELRHALTCEASNVILKQTALVDGFRPLAEVIDERAIVNGIVGLLASGGSTNHAIHLVAIAKAAGIIIDWQDMSELSSIVPLLCRIYPNGQADVNHFQAAGGTALLIRELLKGGYLHSDVDTIAGHGLENYCQEPFVENGEIKWRDGIDKSLDEDVISSCSAPFSQEGGLKLLSGNLGRSVIKVSAVNAEHRIVTAPAIVFEHQDELQEKFAAGELEKDFIAVVRQQGPKANGMPELHKLTPVLGLLQDRGFKVALVTDGRMSGASGKVPAAIHLQPEALDGGAIAKLESGDMIELDSTAGTLKVLDDTVLSRQAKSFDREDAQGMGRELFSGFRSWVSDAETGASVFGE